MKPEDIQAGLVQLFAMQRFNDVDERMIVTTLRQSDFAAVLALKGYKEEFKRVSTAKRTIETIEDGYSLPADQALQCLAELKRLRSASRFISTDYQVTRTLVERTLYPRWGVHQTAYDRRRRFLDEWNDVFISYTNRDAYATNQTYSGLIQFEFGKSIDPAVAQKNYIAPAIAKYLEQAGLRSFEDYNQLRCGDDIEDEIRKHCAVSVAFVQVIEPVAFQEPKPPRENWCLNEFNAFEDALLPLTHPADDHRKSFFILARGDEMTAVLPPRPPLAYSLWIDKASRQLHLTLNKYSLPFNELRRDVFDIARQILLAREKLFDSMLGSLE